MLGTNYGMGGGQNNIFFLQQKFQGLFHNQLYVAVTVGNGTGARVPTVITFLFWQISMICFLQHIKTMTKIYSSKSYWIWLKNKKVMAKFVPSATGQLADMRKSTQFSNCSYVLSLREKWIFLSRECCQYCWESI